MEEFGRHRQLRGIQRLALLSMVAIGIAVGLYFIFQIPIYLKFLPWVSSQQLGAIMMGMFLATTFFYFPANKKARRDTVPWYDIMLALLSLVVFLWIALSYPKVQASSYIVHPPSHVVVLATICVVLVFESLRRTAGMLFGSLILIFSIYPMISSYLPGMLESKGWSFERTVSFFYLSTESMLGLPVNVTIRILLAFLIFAALLSVTGGGKFITDFALSLAGRVRGGPAKVSVLASSMFGSISGSALLNVVTTGTITIPLMKRTGFKPEYAAAVESVSSTGGQLLPPVMGVTAFLMAEFLDISYATVALAAAIPSIIYYLTVFLQVDFRAAREGMKGLPASQLPAAIPTLKKGWFVIASLLILIWVLIVMKWSPGKAALFASAMLILGSFSTREMRFTWRRFVDFLSTAGRSVAEITPIMLAIGILIGSVMLTGIGGRFTSMLVGEETHGLAFIMAMSAIAAFILGMGLPIIGVYIIVAIFIAPALVTAGIPALAVHLALLYWSCLSFLTPPVCLAVYVAAGMANAKVWPTARHAVTLGFAAYAVPILLILRPGLALQDTPASIAIAVIVCLVFVVFLAAAIEGYIFSRAGLTERLAFATGAILTVTGLLLNLYVLIMGLVFGLTAIGYNFAKRKQRHLIYTASTFAMANELADNTTQTSANGEKLR